VIQMALIHRCDQNGPPPRREEEAYPTWICDRRATWAPGHFHRHRQAAVFCAAGCVARLTEIAADIGAAFAPCPRRKTQAAVDQIRLNHCPKQ